MVRNKAKHFLGPEERFFFDHEPCPLKSSPSFSTPNAKRYYIAFNVLCVVSAVTTIEYGPIIVPCLTSNRLPSMIISLWYTIGDRYFSSSEITWLKLAAPDASNSRTHLATELCHKSNGRHSSGELCLVTLALIRRDQLYQFYVID